jgi:hypothetical protein
VRDDGLVLEVSELPIDEQCVGERGDGRHRAHLRKALWLVTAWSMIIW